ncbi:MAG TPA: hypothetical protein VFU54_03950 [Actinomycetota bacterium]|nr:hypothetical protein [Actinomycetota bacterium]
MTSQPQLLHPAAPPEPPAKPRPSGRWWLLAAAAAVALSITLTWPLALHPEQRWSVRLPGPRPGLFGAPPASAFAGDDSLQTMHVNRVVIDNVRRLREPYLDLVSGAAGPEPLRTTSLDLPWTAVEAPLLPLVGLVAAYNSTLVLSSVLTVLCAFGLLRRHTRYLLLALAGALVYAFVPGRMFQLSLHFNALMWWAFPAAAWALEAMLERHRSGHRWLAPGLWLAGVTLTVGLSGEYHHSLYLSGMIGFLVVWRLVAAALRRAPVPLGPAVLALGAVAVTDAYVLGSFRWVFGGSVAGQNGRYDEVVRYAPRGLLSLVHKNLGELGEGLVYLGWPLTLLALAGGVAVLLRRRTGQAPYVALAVPVLFLTFGPAADLALQRALARVGLPHGIEPYRLLFDGIPFLKLQRVTARMLVLAALLLVLLAVVAVDGAAGWAARRWWPRFGPVAPATAALVLVVGTGLLLNDYRMFRAVLRPAETGNRVTVALEAAGDRAGPFLGLPVSGPTVPWNSASTYLASQTGRRTLNAYNQSPMPWLEARAASLDPLNQGRVDDTALAVLRGTGTRQVVVVDEPHIYCCGEWRGVVDGLVASGHFRLMVDDPPFALLELTGPA